MAPPRSRSKSGSKTSGPGPSSTYQLGSSRTPRKSEAAYPQVTSRRPCRPKKKREESSFDQSGSQQREHCARKSEGARSKSSPFSQETDSFGISPAQSPSCESQMSSYHMSQPPPGSFGSVGPGYTSSRSSDPNWPGDYGSYRTRAPKEAKPKGESEHEALYRSLQGNKLPEELKTRLVGDEEMKRKAEEMQEGNWRGPLIDYRIPTSRRPGRPKKKREESSFDQSGSPQREHCARKKEGARSKSSSFSQETDSFGISPAQSPSWESQMSYHMGQPPPGSFGSVGPGYTSTARIEPGVYYLTSPCVVHSQPKSLSVSMGHLEQGPHTGSSESYPSRGHMGYEQQGHHTGGFGFNPSSGSMCYPQQGYPTVRSEPYPSSGHPKQGPHHTGGSGSNPSSGDMAYQQQRHHTGRSEPFSSSGDTRNPQQSHRKPRGKSSVTVASLLQSPSTRSPPRR